MSNVPILFRKMAKIGQQRGREHSSGSKKCFNYMYTYYSFTELCITSDNGNLPAGNV